jgi:hypothetical protein
MMLVGCRLFALFANCESKETHRKKTAGGRGGEEAECQREETVYCVVK